MGKASKEKQNRAASFVIFLLLFLSFFIASVILSYIAIYLGYPSGNLPFLEDAGLGFSMSLATLAYLTLRKGMNRAQIISALGISRKNLSLFMAGLALLLFAIIMLVSIASSAIGAAFGTQINTNVTVALAGAPIWFYIFVAVIEPINEEILFRGLMVPRLGIFISALVFGLAHASYDSTFAIEVIAAFIFGIAAGYVFRKSGSLYPSMIAHILVNSIAVIAILG